MIGITALAKEDRLILGLRQGAIAVLYHQGLTYGRLRNIVSVASRVIVWQSEARAKSPGGLPKRQNLDKLIVLEFCLMLRSLFMLANEPEIGSFAKTAFESQRGQRLQSTHSHSPNPDYRD